MKPVKFPKSASDLFIDMMHERINGEYECVISTYPSKNYDETIVEVKHGKIFETVVDGIITELDIHPVPKKYMSCNKSEDTVFLVFDDFALYDTQLSDVYLSEIIAMIKNNHSIGEYAWKLSTLFETGWMDKELLDQIDEAYSLVPAQDTYIHDLKYLSLVDNELQESDSEVNHES